MADQTLTAPASELECRVMVPTKRRVRLSELWTTLPVARMVGLRDMKIKYKQSALGPLWLVIQPLAMLLAVTIAFSGVSNVDTGDIPYWLFALVGLAVWTYVQLTITLGAATLPANAPLVRRSACPRVALITAALITNLPPLAIMTVAAVAGLAVTGHLAIQALLLPVMLVWLLAFSLGPTLLISSVGARFRDAVAVVPLIVQAGVFVSPVGYPLSQAPDALKTLLAVNPVSGIIEAFRWSLMGAEVDAIVILVSLVWTVILCGAGWWVFGRLEVRFADYV